MFKLKVADRLTSKFLNRLDRNLAIGGIVAGIAAIFLLGHFAPDYISTGVVLIIACTLYLSLARRVQTTQGKEISRHLPFSPYLLSNIVFFALLTYSTLILYLGAYERPLGYFLALASMSTLAAWEIFSFPKESRRWPTIILSKILVISLSLRVSLFYLYPGSFLGTDPWWNSIAFERISQEGHLIRDIGMYYFMPVQHFIVVTTSYLTGLATREAMIISLGLFEVVSLTFVFLLGRDLFNRRIGLLAALILGINNLHIMWGWLLVAQTIGLSLATLILFLTLNPKVPHTTNIKMILILAIAVLIITHTASSFITLVIMLLLYLGYTLFSYLSKIPLPYLHRNITLLFVVSLIGYWLYITNFFTSFVRLFVGIDSPLSVATPYAPSLITKVNPVWSEINKLGNLLFYGLATIGLLSILSPRNINTPRFTLAFCGISLTALVFAVFFLAETELLIGRWFIFMDLILVIPVALGLNMIIRSLGATWKRWCTLNLIIFAMTFLMVTNTTAAFDSPLYPNYLKSQNVLKVSELRAAETVKTLYPGAPIMDTTHSLALKASPDSSASPLSYQDIQTGFQKVDALLVLREYITQSAFRVLAKGVYYITEFTYDPYQVLDDRRLSRVYDVGTVSAYLP
jgi:hypothetical protein